MAAPRFRLVADLADQLNGLQPATFGIGPDGSLWFGLRTLPRPSRPGSSPADRDYWFAPHDLVIAGFRDDVCVGMVTARVPRFQDFVQPTPGGLLLVAGRTGGEPNARVVDPSAKLVREFLLGDGITDVQATDAGDIWVSYFDEGVFGGVWKAPGGGCFENLGLVRANLTGEVQMTSVASGAVTPIDDCYALNADGSGRETWVCCHSDFPLMRVSATMVHAAPGPPRTVDTGHSRSTGRRSCSVADTRQMRIES